MNSIACVSLSESCRRQFSAGALAISSSELPRQTCWLTWQALCTTGRSTTHSALPDHAAPRGLKLSRPTVTDHDECGIC
eukprot:4705553-Amphidinium_carterae.1